MNTRLIEAGADVATPPVAEAPKPLPPAIPEAIECRFIETETRATAVVGNFWRYVLWTERTSDAEAARQRRLAASSAFWLWLGSRMVRSAPAAAIGAGVSVTAIASVIIAMKANALLETQNRLSEAQRRAAASQELTAIYDAVTAYVERCGVRCANQSEPQVLSSVLEARIASALKASRPYRYLDLEAMEARPELPPPDGTVERIWGELRPEPVTLSRLISPERGQLLTLLHEANLDLSAISTRARFDYADLGFAALDGLELSAWPRNTAADTSPFGRSPTSTYVQHARLTGASLKGARLDNVVLSHSDMRGVDLSASWVVALTCERCDLSPLPEDNIENNGSSMATFARHARFERGGFLNATLDGLYAESARFLGVEFLAVDAKLSMRGARLDRAVFHAEPLVPDDGAPLYGSFSGDVDGAVDLGNVRAIEARFERYAWSNVSARDADFRKATFRDATMTSVDFSNADLRCASFVGMEMSDIVWRGADLAAVDFRQSRIETSALREARNWKQACVSTEQASELGIPASRDCTCPKPLDDELSELTSALQPAQRAESP